MPHAFDLWLPPTLGELQLREVTVGVLEDVLLDLDSTGFSTAQMRSVLNQVLRMALRYEAIRTNPMASVEPLQRAHREVETLDVDEVRLLRRLVQPEFVRTPGRRGPNRDLADVVDVSLGTGGRVGEVLAFRWEDLCWVAVEAGEMAPALRVRGTLIEPRKGYVANLYRQPYTKGGGGRCLIIPAHLHELLVSRREQQTSCDASDPVFASRVGTWLWPNNLRTRLRAAVADTELVGTSPHTLRRTVGTAIGHSMGLEAAREQLGHRHPGITPRHYVADRLFGPDVRPALDMFFDVAPSG